MISNCNYVTMIIDAKYLYRTETGRNPKGCTYDVFRSKGQWILSITDEKVLNEIGLSGEILIPDQEYLDWLENKVIELLTHKN